ncbi:MAG: aspartate ammonia-lyase [Tissierellia bacterium]|nr:aspartate ammonia-lyase [Tissierellia bacterium]
MNNYRIETDSVGEKNVPNDALYGVHTLRGLENFNITGETIHEELINSLAIIKKACAIANYEAGILDISKKDAIVKACDDITHGKYREHILNDPIQGGAGTTANMNINEVIANVADEYLGAKRGEYKYVHPNDDVNMGQSTNDVFPTAGKIAALRLLPQLLNELNLIIDALMEKAIEFDDVLKMGRTQLQDAVPIRLGQEFHAYASVLKRDKIRIEQARKSILSINLGASAIGTGINVDLKYFDLIIPTLASLTGLKLVRPKDLIDETNNLDSLVELSSALKINAINLSKISNDLRLLSSGPKTMVGDINLPPRQNGSSIMPGKVNPVIPEVVSQVAFKVVGNDTTISMCAEAGQLELNAFEPVLFYSLFQSIEILGRAMNTLRINCIYGITANVKKLDRDIAISIGIVTALVPHIGYKKAADIAKKALAEERKVRDLVIEEGLMTPEELEEIFDPKAMTQPGIVGRHLLIKKKD